MQVQEVFLTNNKIPSHFEVQAYLCETPTRWHVIARDPTKEILVNFKIDNVLAVFAGLQKTLAIHLNKLSEEISSWDNALLCHSQFNQAVTKIITKYEGLKELPDNTNELIKKMADLPNAIDQVRQLYLELLEFKRHGMT